MSSVKRDARTTEEEMAALTDKTDDKLRQGYQNRVSASHNQDLPLTFTVS